MKYFIIKTIRKAFKIFFVFPIKKHRIIFTAYNGRQYSCNPKYIFENLIEKESCLEYIWAFEEPENFELHPNVKKVRYKSISYVYYLLTSKIVIENSESWSVIPRRSNQIVINTWHGGGAYKKVGKLRKDGQRYNNENVEYKNRRINMYISSSEAFTKMTLNNSFGYNGNILKVGMPRNDLLINNNVDSYNKLKENLKVKSKQIVLIAPTFRNITDFDLRNFNFKKLIEALQKRFGGDWVIFYRSHYYENNSVDTDYLVDVSEYGDMQELLFVSDILITDFSSSMWDFSLMKKPVFLYSTDLIKYEKHERGFYTDPTTWPFPIATNFDDLILNIDQFDQCLYKKKVEKHHNDLKSYESGSATEYISKYILDIIDKQKVG